MSNYNDKPGNPNSVLSRRSFLQRAGLMISLPLFARAIKDTQDLPQTITIELAGIMLLSFNGKEKCTIGIPPTDDRHEFLLTVDGRPHLIGKRSSLAVVDTTHEHLPARVTKQVGFFDAVIDFKSVDFHPELTFREGYAHRQRLEIFNGHFEVGRIVPARFQRGTAELDLTRGVAESLKLIVPVGDSQRVVFTDVNGEINLQPGQQISITNKCNHESCDGEPDFQFHYRAFDVAYDQQRIPVIEKLPSSETSSKGITGCARKLPCWLGGYEESPEQPLPA